MKLNQLRPKIQEPAVAPVRLEDWNRLNHTLQGVTGYYFQDVSELSGELPEKLKMALVAPRFLQESVRRRRVRVLHRRNAHSRSRRLWTPSPPDAPYAQSRESTWFTAIGRLKPGITLAQARADLATVQTDLGRQYPKTDATIKPVIVPLKDATVGATRKSLWILFGSVSLLAADRLHQHCGAAAVAGQRAAARDFGALLARCVEGGGSGATLDGSA